MQTTHNLPAVVDAQTVAALLEQHAPLKIIDVRTPAEFEAVHIPGSYNVPLDALPAHRAELRDTLRAPAVLVCCSGARVRPRGCSGQPTSTGSTSSTAASRPGRRRARPSGAAESVGHWSDRSAVRPDHWSCAASWAGCAPGDP